MVSQMLNDFYTVLDRGSFVVLDTETTGVQRGEICQIAIVNQDAHILLDTLVRPIGGIPADASKIHGITDTDVEDAPGWPDIAPTVRDLLNGQNVLVYNATYDRKMMHQSAEAAFIEKIDWKAISNWYCVMEAFAELYGDWNAYHGSYRWQKLSVAASYYRIEQRAAHSALDDCMTTLHVIRGMQKNRSTFIEG